MHSMNPFLVLAHQSGELQDSPGWNSQDRTRCRFPDEVLRDARERNNKYKAFVTSGSKPVKRGVSMSRVQYGDADMLEVLEMQRYRESGPPCEPLPEIEEPVPLTRTLSRTLTTTARAQRTSITAESPPLAAETSQRISSTSGGGVGGTAGADAAPAPPAQLRPSSSRRFQGVFGSVVCALRGDAKGGTQEDATPIRVSSFSGVMCGGSGSGGGAGAGNGNGAGAPVQRDTSSKPIPARPASSRSCIFRRAPARSTTDGQSPTFLGTSPRLVNPMVSPGRRAPGLSLSGVPERVDWSDGRSFRGVRDQQLIPPALESAVVVDLEDDAPGTSSCRTTATGESPVVMGPSRRRTSGLLHLSSASSTRQQRLPYRRASTAAESIAAEPAAFFSAEAPLYDDGVSVSPASPQPVAGGPAGGGAAGFTRRSSQGFTPGRFERSIDGGRGWFAAPAASPGSSCSPSLAPTALAPPLQETEPPGKRAESSPACTTAMPIGIAIQSDLQLACSPFMSASPGDNAYVMSQLALEGTRRATSRHALSPTRSSAYRLSPSTSNSGCVLAFKCAPPKKPAGEVSAEQVARNAVLAGWSSRKRLSARNLRITPTNSTGLPDSPTAGSPTAATPPQQLPLQPSQPPHPQIPVIYGRAVLARGGACGGLVTRASVEGSGGRYGSDGGVAGAGGRSGRVG